MPEFLRDWNLWWVDYLTDNPVVFWGLLALVVGLTIYNVTRR